MRLTATTAGTPNVLIVLRWRLTLAKPTSIAFSDADRSTRGSFSTPEWCLIARMVVTSTAADGRQLAEAADDVEELLHPHVRAEARLGDDVVGDLHAHLIGDQASCCRGRCSANGPAVHQHRLALERLHQVGLQGVLEQHRHRPGGAEVLGGDRLGAVERVSGGDPADPLAQILESRATAMIAITSDAAVMSKPVSRG